MSIGSMTLCLDIYRGGGQACPSTVPEPGLAESYSALEPHAIKLLAATRMPASFNQITSVNPCPSPLLITGVLLDGPFGLLGDQPDARRYLLLDGLISRWVV